MAITTTSEKKQQRTRSATPNTGALAKQEQRPLTTREEDSKKKINQLAQIIEAKRESFAMVAGEHFRPERLIKLAHGALSRVPKLGECTNESLLVSLMRCAELELEPDGALPQRRMWLVPRWNGKIHAQECTYLMDFRAQIQKARDTELVTAVLAEEVREKDEFVLYDTDEGTSLVKFRFQKGGDRGAFSDRGSVVGYFAAARLGGDEVQIVTMSKKEAEKFRNKYGPRDRNNSLVGPWVGGDDQFDEMAKKTCLRKLWKHLPAGKSAEARKLQEHISSESDIEEGRRSVVSTAPFGLDLTLPDAEVKNTTAEEVERALTDSPPDDVDLQAREEEKTQENPTRNARIAKIREEAQDQHGVFFLDAWSDACRECAGNRPSTAWTDKEILAVADYLSRWTANQETDIAPAEREPGSDDE